MRNTHSLVATSRVTRDTTPTIRQPRSRTDGADAIQTFLSSRWTRVGAAATGAALLATLITGAVAAYDDRAASRWTAAGEGGAHAAYSWNATDDDKGSGKANQPRPDDKKDDRSDNGNKPANPPSASEGSTNNAERERDTAPEPPKREPQTSKANDPPKENTQGKSGSNPDGGGYDKPPSLIPPGGTTQGDEDRDGNNGSGNDEDCSDDNNGRGPKGCDDVDHSKKTPAATIVAGQTAVPGVTETPKVTVTPGNECTDGEENGSNDCDIFVKPTNTPPGMIVSGETPAATDVAGETAVTESTPAGSNPPAPTNTPTGNQSGEPAATNTPVATAVGGAQLTAIPSNTPTGNQAVEPVATSTAIATVASGTSAEGTQGNGGPVAGSLSDVAGAAIHAPGEEIVEAVLGVQARRGYENVVAGAMSSTGGAPLGAIAGGLALLGGMGLALRRYTRRSL
jgi:hypothetical protein